MSIQQSEGPIVFDRSDWQYRFNGVLFGIKIRFIPAAYVTVGMLCENVNGTWQPVANIDDDMSRATDVDTWIAKAAQITNAWAAKRFTGISTITVTTAAPTAGSIIEQIDKALPQCLHIKAASITTNGANIKRISVIGDSISSQNNGASAVAWPELVGKMIKSMGVFDVEVRNYSIPGLTYATALVPTAGWLIAGMRSPAQAVAQDGTDLIIICLGVNDRDNANALADAMALRDSTSAPIMFARQAMVGSGSIVSQDQQDRMNAVYAALGGDGCDIGIGKLYSMGMTYDGLHPTNTGKQWFASGVYMYLQQYLPLTPIVRNIAWLYDQTSAMQQQIKNASL
jgi:lysophospholipase L1-like esterase